MAWEWKEGDRAKVVNSAGLTRLLTGQVFEVIRPEMMAGQPALKVRSPTGARLLYAWRFKPVVRVQAPSRPTGLFDCCDAMGGKVVR